MKLVEDVKIRCVQCVNAKGYSSCPSEYEKRVAEWAFQLNGMRGVCHDSQKFVACALKKKFPSSGKCAWFEKK